MSGRGTVDGVFYPGLPSTPFTFGDTTLQFDVAPITLPAATPAQTTIRVTAPFTMTGTLVMANGATQVFNEPVTGAGELAFTLTSFGPQYGITFDFGTFSFESSAAPTPEPATMLLLASGLAVAAARRFRRGTTPSLPTRSSTA